jgi:hypothetical protein
MSIQVTCKCGKVLKASAEHAGKWGRCKECKAPIHIPGPEPGITPPPDDAMSKTAEVARDDDQSKPPVTLVLTSTAPRYDPFITVCAELRATRKVNTRLMDIAQSISTQLTFVLLLLGALLIRSCASTEVHVTSTPRY